MVNAEELTNAIYAFWFGKEDPHKEDYAHNNKLWWGGGLAVDREINEKFGSFVEQVVNSKGGELETELEKSPRGSMALIIMLDQFTRSIYRGTPRMFSGDEKALKIAKQLVSSGADKQLSLPERLFITTPFQHSENVDDVEKSKQLTEEIFNASKGSQAQEFEGAVTYAESHAEIVRKFGRYPHRNQILSRKSTPAEEEFLADAAKNSSYGFMSSVNNSSTEKKPRTNGILIGLFSFPPKKPEVKRSANNNLGVFDFVKKQFNLNLKLLRRNTFVCAYPRLLIGVVAVSVLTSIKHPFYSL